MKKTKNGFTLIELLVVVLIIGILAAVALPKYRLAILKAKTVRALAALHTLADAQKRYYMANGSWPSKFEDLDIVLPCKMVEGSRYCNFNDTEGSQYILNGGIATFHIGKDMIKERVYFNEYLDGRRYAHTCLAASAAGDSSVSNRLCKSLEYELQSRNTAEGCNGGQGCNRYVK